MPKKKVDLFAPNGPRTTMIYSDRELAYAMSVVVRASRGKLPFAYGRVRPSFKHVEISNRLKRANKYDLVGQDWKDRDEYDRAQRHNYLYDVDHFPTQHTAAKWRSNYIRINSALNKLWKAGKISDYHIDPHGRLRITYETNGDSVKIDFKQGSNMQTCFKGKKSKFGLHRYMFEQAMRDKISVSIPDNPDAEIGDGVKDTELYYHSIALNM